MLPLVFAVQLMHIGAAWQAARNTGLTAPQAHRLAGIVAIVLAAICSMAAYVSSQGFLVDSGAKPPYVLRYIFPHAMFALLLGALSPYGRRLALGLPMWLLIGCQAFRIPVEFLLHGFYIDGLAPVQMTYLGRNFDILTGITAIPLAWLVMRDKASRTVIWLWNGMGLILLANVVGTAILSLPGSFRLFPDGPTTAFITGFPYLFVPVLFVPTALFGHVLVFRRLLAGRN